jgi:hypothetical protein
MLSPTYSCRALPAFARRKNMSTRDISLKRFEKKENRPAFGLLTLKRYQSMTYPAAPFWL